MFPTPQLTALRARYKLDVLLREVRKQEAFFVQGYRMRGHEISRARVVRSRALLLRGGGRLRNSVWLSDDRAARKALEQNPILVDSFELTSFANAEHALLGLLGEFHVPIALRTVPDGIGDVAFISPDERFVAFLRGNSLHRLAQEHPARPLTDVARAIDEALVAKPDDAEHVLGAFDLTLLSQRETLAPQIAEGAAPAAAIAAQYRFAGVGAPRARSRVPAEAAFAAATAEDEAPMVRIFSKGGWIEDHDGLRFNLNADTNCDEAEIEIFEETTDGHCTHCRRALKDGRWAADY